MKDVLVTLDVWGLKSAYRAMETAFHGQVPLQQRLEKAYNILVRDPRYSIFLVPRKEGHPIQFTVLSPHGTYTVTPEASTCTCPDAERAVLCKHRIAIQLILDARRLSDMYWASY